MYLKNIYGAKILIPIADCPPTANWTFTTAPTDHSVGIIGVSHPEDSLYYEDYGIFTRKAFDELCEAQLEFEKEYTWLPLIEKWVPNDLLDF